MKLAWYAALLLISFNVSAQERILDFFSDISIQNDGSMIVEETIKAGGSMCHHHGVGKHRTPWIEDEYGSSYYILDTLKKAFDPNAIMNPGTIIPLEK